MSYMGTDPGDLTNAEMYDRPEKLRRRRLLSPRERGVCTNCREAGCEDCCWTGLQLSRADFLRLSAEGKR